MDNSPLPTTTESNHGKSDRGKLVLSPLPRSCVTARHCIPTLPCQKYRMAASIWQALCTQLATKCQSICRNPFESCLRQPIRSTGGSKLMGPPRRWNPGGLASMDLFGQASTQSPPKSRTHQNSSTASVCVRFIVIRSPDRTATPCIGVDPVLIGRRDGSVAGTWGRAMACGKSRPCGSTPATWTAI